ncbi:hypothetical protein M8494_21840 [Serratia ureilytica]
MALSPQCSHLRIDRSTDRQLVNSERWSAQRLPFCTARRSGLLLQHMTGADGTLEQLASARTETTISFSFGTLGVACVKRQTPPRTRRLWFALP